MDETIITLNNFDRARPIYYVLKEDDVPEKWKKKNERSWLKQVMVAFGICWNGVSRAYFVGKKPKITARYFVDHILSKMVEHDIPRLFP